MTTVKLETGGKVSMEVTGHAGYAEQGNDIVCAACTTLTYVVAFAVNQLYEDGLMMEPPVCSWEGVTFRMECVPSPYAETQLQAVLDSVMNTYQTIADQFPQCVNILL